MTDEAWHEVDRYFTNLLVGRDADLTRALEHSHSEGLPAIELSPPHAKLLNLIVRMTRARRVLEIGTLGGYSAIWIARALPDHGILVTLEALPHHVEVARHNIANAGLTDKVQIKLGPAAESLAQLVSDGARAFDVVFIDADKASNPQYLEWALMLTEPGSVIVCDNVVRSGRVLDESGNDPDIVGVRRFLDMVADDPRLDATAIQTVGYKGWDGFAIAIVNG